MDPLHLAKSRGSQSCHSHSHSHNEASDGKPKSKKNEKSATLCFIQSCISLSLFALRLGNHCKQARRKQDPHDSARQTLANPAYIIERQTSNIWSSQQRSDQAQSHCCQAKARQPCHHAFTPAHGVGQSPEQRKRNIVDWWTPLVILVCRGCRSRSRRRRSRLGNASLLAQLESDFVCLSPDHRQHICNKQQCSIDHRSSSFVGWLPCHPFCFHISINSGALDTTDQCTHQRRHQQCGQQLSIHSNSRQAGARRTSIVSNCFSVRCLQPQAKVIIRSSTTITTRQHQPTTTQQETARQRCRPCRGR